VERERTLGAHGRRPRRRRWGIGAGHRPALPPEEFFAYLYSRENERKGWGPGTVKGAVASGRRAPSEKGGPLSRVMGGGDAAKIGGPRTPGRGAGENIPRTGGKSLETSVER
jgi:hypothetical protein